MHTRWLMSGSAAFLAVLGFAGTFAPAEVLARFGASADAAAVLLLQVAAAAYLGFAMLNWSAKGVLIGGIYARPLALGNFLHFVMLALLVARLDLATHPVALLILLPAGLFGVWFGVVLFRPPVARL
jgi:hypothetical protein